MKRVFFLPVCLWLLLSGGESRAATERPPVARIGGRDYVSLADWARRRQFDLRWVGKEDELLLTNRSASLGFKLNSQRAEINGVSAFLSFPLLPRNGEPFIAAKDADQLLAPILNPPRNKRGARIKTIALCPGHGGKDVGFIAKGDLEKQYTLLLSREVERQLKAGGFKVIQLRADDRFVGLEERAAVANRRRADLYVSLHYNSAGPQSPEVGGCEVYSLTLPGTASTNGGSPRNGTTEPGDRNSEKSVLLAYQIQKSMVASLGLQDRGIRRARFVVLRLATMPAVLIETAFMSNPGEMRQIRDAGFRRRTARAIVDGLVAYKRLVES
jgi:N-acetylmuramoyl-L-alanine amidase